MNALDALSAAPRLVLGMEPTPLRRVPALEAALSKVRNGPVPRILIKHDEMTGFGLGGNKVRKLETELAGDRLAGVTCLITTGGPQSNHARVTAAVAAYLGLECHIVVNGPGSTEPHRGNARLHRLFGAQVNTVASRGERAPTMQRLAAQVGEAGGRALVVPLGASTGRGALGYVRAMVEFDGQLPRSDRVTDVFVSSSSGGTLAGLRLGGALLDRTDLRLVPVSADTPAAELDVLSAALADEAFTLLGGVGPAPSIPVEAVDAQVGDGYGVPTRASREAAQYFAGHAGTLLDQTYTAKAAAELVRRVIDGALDPAGRVVFWHTGGWPALFAEDRYTEASRP